MSQNLSYSVRHVGLVVSDLASSVRFWTALGFSIENDQVESNPFISELLGFPVRHLRTVKMRDPSHQSCVELLEFSESECNRSVVQPHSLGLTHIALDVKSIEQTAILIEAFGGSMLSNGIQGPTGKNLRVAYFRLDAYTLLELVQKT